jgi:hypothetical protein
LLNLSVAKQNLPFIQATNDCEITAGLCFMITPGSDTISIRRAIRKQAARLPAQFQGLEKLTCIGKTIKNKNYGYQEKQ